MPVVLASTCVRCGACPAIDAHGYCGYCHWQLVSEIARGLDELADYLAGCRPQADEGDRP